MNEQRRYLFGAKIANSWQESNYEADLGKIVHADFRPLYTIGAARNHILPDGLISLRVDKNASVKIHN